MQEHLTLTIAGVMAAAALCQWFAWWVKLPAILFLLLAGILAGPVTGWIDPDALFGDLLFPLVSLSVAVILFEGSLTLKFSEIAGLEHVVRRMVTSGVLISWGIVAFVTYHLLDFPPELAVLFGAFMVVTGPTVIVPLLRTVRPTAHVANILRWEGIVIDPVGALLAVLVFEFIISGQAGAAFGHTLVSFAKIVAVGLVIGVTSGHLVGLGLRHHWFPEYLHNVIVLAVVFSVFSLSNAVEAEAGLLTVTVMGLWLANMKKVSVEHILDFKESLSLVLISGLFIILAARVDFAQFEQLGWPALGVLAAVQFLARPLKIAVATYGSKLRWQERLLLAWIGPRGIVAAAVAALFAIRLSAVGYEQAELLVPLTFMIIIGTVVMQSATSGMLARALGVAEPEARGFLVVGANPLACVIAKALQKKGYDSLLCDTNWNHIKAARMQGLSTFYGSPVSEYADRRLDLIGLGHLLALSPQRELNMLAVHRYRREFGDKHLFTLLAGDTDENNKQTGLLPAGHVAFGNDVSYSGLTSAISAGAEIRETMLTESFDFDDYYRKYYKRATPLFAIDPKGHLHCFAADRKVKPAPQWTILSLIVPQEDKQTESEEEANEPAAG